MLYKILKITQLTHRVGFDVTVNFFDKEKEVDKNITFFWVGKKEPTLLLMDVKLKHLEDNIIDSLIEEIPTSIEIEEVEKILKEKELITTEETWEDFKSKEVL